MIRVIIGDVESEISSVSESWINQHINRRNADGQNVCVRVIIHTDKLNMTLSTPSCAVGQPGRQPSSQEAAVFDMWEQCGLKQTTIHRWASYCFLEKI